MMKKSYKIILCFLSLTIFVLVGLLFLKPDPSKNSSLQNDYTEKHEIDTGDASNDIGGDELLDDIKDEDESLEEDNENEGVVADNSLNYIAPQASISIVNKQNTNNDVTYSYDINIEGVSGAIEIFKENELEYLVFDAKGNVSVTLKSNESVTLNGIAVGKKYTIKQKEVPGYNLTVNNQHTNVFSGTTAEDNNLVTFDNKATIVEVVKENPVTNDFISIVFVIMAISLGVIFVLSKTKIKKYQ